MGIAALWLLTDAARGQVFVANSTTGTVNEFSSDGDLQGTFSASSGPQGIALSGSTLFVASSYSGTIGQYTIGGVEMNASFVASLNAPQAVQVSGGSLYVLSYDDDGYGVIGKYNASDGTPQNAALISQLESPGEFAVSDGYAYVTNFAGSVSKFDINTGEEILNLGETFLTGLDSPWGIAVSGSDLYVTNYNNGTIGKYTTSGGTTNSTLISGLTHPWGVAVGGDDLYVSNYGDDSDPDNIILGSVGKYTVAGGTLNAALVSTLSGATGIAAIPEPAAWMLLGPSLAGLILLRSRRREIASK